MTDLTRDDVRAAVSAGMINEAQAASLLVLSEERRGVRERVSGLDEPFELFRGFNEIFIVVGLGILYAGWGGLTGFSLLSAENGYISAIFMGLVAAVITVGLAQYFTVTRRMVAPSIALVIFFGMAVAQMGMGVSWALDFDTPEALTMAAGLSTLALGGYYFWFRVPFAIALIALGVFATSFGFVTIGGTFPDDPRDFFLLTNDGPFAILTFGLGVIGFVIAMWFDMGDPHRVSMRSRAGFWLHVIAAPAIVNTVALTLFSIGGVTVQLVLLVFVGALALVAVVIDRRSFLVAGVGYIVALAITVLEDGAFLAVLVLGLVLVLLGAKWEALRSAIMRALPGFPGKDRLPPWAV